MMDRYITKNMVESCVQEFEKILNDKVEIVRSRISDARYGGSEFYISDMKGYQRGLIDMGNQALSFFKSKLLGSK